MKFFLFNINEPTEGSERASDSGIGVSTFCVPVDKLCNITSSKGFINMTFDNAGIYDEALVRPGEALNKVNVTIASDENQEVLLIKSILNFISVESAQKILTFDIVEKTSLFSAAKIESISDIKLKIPTMPINMETGRLSAGSASDEYQDTIAGINFHGNLPSLDFNHEGLDSFADTAEITSWRNAGTGGVTYSIASNVGTPSCETDAATSGINQKSVYLQFGENFVIPNAFSVRGDYTLYCVLGASIRAMVLYGDSAGETMGFGGGMVSGAIDDANDVSPKAHSFTVRHSGMTGAAATVQTDNTDNGTISYRWPDYYESEQDVSKMDVDVWIIRRDKDYNIFLHNRDGDIIGFIPAKTEFLDDTLLATTPGRTDGDLLIQELGTSGSVTTASFAYFRGYISRFGVIPNDIGAAKSATLAQDLFKFYNP
tara:strand:+ start:3205 stop:4491 length:1287 start_codon:yes stop_codon:yes gene_type:complete